MMNNRTKNIIGGIGLALMAICGTGYAWYAGKIGNNPNAPTDVNFERILKEFAARREPLPTPSCLLLYWPLGPDGEPIANTAAGEGNGMLVPGVEGEMAPPYLAQTFLITPRNATDAGTRKQQLAAFDKMVKEGFFDTTETTITYPSGEALPARTYKMTSKGWQNSRDDWCMNFADMRTTRYVRAEPIGKHDLGDEAYKVFFERDIADIAPWASGPEFKEGVERVRKDSHHETSIIAVRDSQGLRIPPQKDGYGEKDQKIPSKADILEVLAMKGVRGAIPQIEGFYPGLYLPADEQNVDEAWNFSHQDQPYYAIYYDVPKSKITRDYVMWRARFKALTELGLMNEEKIRGDFNGPYPEEAGTKYTFKEPPGKITYQDPGYAYITGGRFELNFLQIAPNDKNYNADVVFRGVAEVKDPVPWFVALKDHPLFNEITVMLNKGQSFRGYGGETGHGFGISAFNSWPLRPRADSLLWNEDGSLKANQLAGSLMARPGSPGAPSSATGPKTEADRDRETALENAKESCLKTIENEKKGLIPGPKPGQKDYCASFR